MPTTCDRRSTCDFLTTHHRCFWQQAPATSNVQHDMPHHMDLVMGLGTVLMCWHLIALPQGSNRPAGQRRRAAGCLYKCF